jgi:hypothetical protein
MAKKFPAKLFVKIEEDGKTLYFVPADSLNELADMNETIKIGVYQLVETVFAETVVKTSGSVKK